jgi:hypothetical protein
MHSRRHSSVECSSDKPSLTASTPTPTPTAPTAPAPPVTQQSCCHLCCQAQAQARSQLANQATIRQAADQRPVIIQRGKVPIAAVQRPLLCKVWAPNTGPAQLITAGQHQQQQRQQKKTVWSAVGILQSGQLGAVWAPNCLPPELITAGQN